ncbi:hypothetical protein RJ640_012992 [Escallonia rubra]|uniref:RING-type E3 ubiquitin transferase n=1 Tax=Escallonia rubra TaxID=112253 RepID=A0AA88UBI0_9ASTE|nr:hypothetical protein RJ640_012992 [Escallonia rubra]
MKMGISGDHSTPSALTPPSSPSPPKSNLQMLYYGLVVVGTAAIILAIYNLIIMRWCANYQRQNRQGMIPTIEATSSRSLDNPNQGLVSSFKYKKEGVADQIGYDNECSVCISVFEEGEEVRKLPRCKHSFHAQCIDMWLYSHLDCPLCRAPVEPPVLRRHADATPSDNSREGLLDPGISA